VPQIVSPGGLIRVNKSTRGLSPEDFDGLFAWFDADDESTLTIQGGSDVESWDDKTGSGQNLSQATTADQPQTGMNTLGGRNVLTFSSDSLNRGSFTTPSAMTIFYLCSIDLVDNAFDSIYSFSGNSSNTDLQVDAGNSGQFDGRLNGNNFGGSNPSFTDGPYAGWHIYRLTLDTSSGVAIYVDGNLKASDGGWTNTIASGTKFAVMENRAGNNLLGGKVAECIIYNTVLSDSDASLLETDYLTGKWGPNATSGSGGGGGK